MEEIDPGRYVLPALLARGTVPAGARFVRVQAGDTPTSIADRAGITARRLLELNPSVEPDALKPGQALKLAP